MEARRCVEVTGVLAGGEELGGGAHRAGGGSTGNGGAKGGWVALGAPARARRRRAAAATAAAAAASPAVASGIATTAAAPSPAVAPRGAPSRAECSVDLKLGGLGEFGAADGTKEPAAAAAPSASPMKRPRLGPSGAAGAQCLSCAVDGYKADLSKCRDYHRRHKVCEAHSKTPVVVVAGREMRFCQQCSSLTPEFSSV
ncbi:squamosa promoter-binding-like protein 18 [Miscanthus floridulus]|uniref:squamosa promoter-binding-like protein 18 n=1 Tax=Miscanthus floridulus TaxID=154761 RepID=UPI003459D0C4